MIEDQIAREGHFKNVAPLLRAAVLRSGVKIAVGTLNGSPEESSRGGIGRIKDRSRAIARHVSVNDRAVLFAVRSDSHGGAVKISVRCQDWRSGRIAVNKKVVELVQVREDACRRELKEATEIVTNSTQLRCTVEIAVGAEGDAALGVDERSA